MRPDQGSNLQPWHIWTLLQPAELSGQGCWELFILLPAISLVHEKDSDVNALSEDKAMCKLQFHEEQILAFELIDSLEKLAPNKYLVLLKHTKIFAYQTRQAK